MQIRSMISLLILCLADVHFHAVVSTSTCKAESDGAGSCGSGDDHKSLRMAQNECNGLKQLEAKRCKLKACKKFLLGPVVNAMDIPAVAKAEIKKHVRSRCLYEEFKREALRRPFEDRKANSRR
eukprot:gnl/TRDRNA2_/TRDRNA2_197902_c0_seq1.p1 gnl/TRDRNA2_/TRDRNA2_197902_c0~~gnl/TRDRNA2_/TRDRNA2_197902_c0_seq1.p1  ORF type:complete len:124 (+),score=14.31 gnl/TRDRNA2_/TRDRNA2_197902_c0_seq1:79-450(+)